MGWYDPIKRGTEELVEALQSGWEKLKRHSSPALTRYTRKRESDDDDALDWIPEEGWSLLSAEVAERGDEVLVRLEAPGMKREDFEITVERGHLIVRGEKRYEREHKDARYHLFESAYGSFQRAITLPCEVNVAAAEAEYTRGVLRVRLPKSEGRGDHRIPIRD
jgi:HSP20 family protein